MLLVCIASYLKSVLIYKLLILDASHPVTLYLRQQGRKNLWLLFEAKRSPQTNDFGQQVLRYLFPHSIR